MALTIERLGRTFFAEVRGVRLAEITDDETCQEILDALMD